MQVIQVLAQMYTSNMKAGLIFNVTTYHGALQITSAYLLSVVYSSLTLRSNVLGYYAVLAMCGCGCWISDSIRDFVIDMTEKTLIAQVFTFFNGDGVAKSYLFDASSFCTLGQGKCNRLLDIGLHKVDISCSVSRFDCFADFRSCYRAVFGPMS